ncbi:MAG: hypothetical protein CMJ32_10930 [Phycisphaerae bacterium]|nr:hypothetical protein [Phycisphaerae bacterium]
MAAQGQIMAHSDTRIPKCETTPVVIRLRKAMSSPSVVVVGEWRAQVYEVVNLKNVDVRLSERAIQSDGGAP